MKHSNYPLGFTLIELLVTMSIVAILIIGAMNTNLSRLSQKQETGIEIIKMTNIFEEIRNNSLIGRGVGTDLDTPDTWKIEVSQENNGNIKSFYTLGGSQVPNENTSWNAKKNKKIMDLECHNFNETLITTINGTGTLIFDGSSISLATPGCVASQKVLFIRYGDENISEFFSFNTLSGVIKRN